MNITRQEFESHLLNACPGFSRNWPRTHLEAIKIVAYNDFIGDVYGNQTYQTALKYIREAAIEFRDVGYLSFRSPDK